MADRGETKSGIKIETTDQFEEEFQELMDEDDELNPEDFFKLFSNVVDVMQKVEKGEQLTDEEAELLKNVEVREVSREELEAEGIEIPEFIESEED